ncbi:hypothetical protein [Arthrobacter sp. B1805]|uniref:hypothetical protein n=1 Tax=Arthrobacter sp. B1805 TaxID=2058892 RepID=UPI0011B0651F|nr:hypothetical protein [Arthrobacter sp. B1805]
MTQPESAPRRWWSIQGTHSPAFQEVPAPAHPGVSAPTTSFTPRWGRIAVALVGLMALVAVPVTLVLAALNVVSLLVPLACAALTAAAVGVLRFLAIRSRRARINNAFAAAMAPVRTTAPETSGTSQTSEMSETTGTAGRAAPQRPTALFDAEDQAVRPLTAMELRTAALAVAHGATAVSVHSGIQAVTEETATQPAGATAWAPVEVPRPTYVDSVKAERQAPAPLDLPEAPKPSSKTPIKAAEAAARSASATADPATTTSGSAPATGRINLDDVLQRRRA